MVFPLLIIPIAASVMGVGAAIHRAKVKRDARKNLETAAEFQKAIQVRKDQLEKNILPALAADLEASITEFGTYITGKSAEILSAYEEHISYDAVAHSVRAQELRLKIHEAPLPKSVSYRISTAEPENLNSYLNRELNSTERSLMGQAALRVNHKDPALALVFVTAAASRHFFDWYKDALQFRTSSLGEVAIQQEEHDAFLKKSAEIEQSAQTDVAGAKKILGDVYRPIFDEVLANATSSSNPLRPWSELTPEECDSIVCLKLVHDELLAAIRPSNAVVALERT